MADAVDDLLVERIGELVQLVLEFLAGFGAGVFFVGAFVLADLHVVGLDAQLVEQAFEERYSIPTPGISISPPCEHADVIGAGGHRVGGRVEAVGIHEAPACRTLTIAASAPRSSCPANS